MRRNIMGTNEVPHFNVLVLKLLRAVKKKNKMDCISFLYECM